MSTNHWIIDGLELDRPSFTLRRNGKTLRLDPKPLELLFLLVESQGAVISHGEALRRVWGEDVFVNGEAALYTAVKKIRQAIGDPSLIETVPGRGYRLRAAANGRATRAASPVPSQQDEQRLAILPLANLANDPEQNYFSDGLTEELINTISRLLRGRMGVIARTSVMRYRAVSKPVQQIARELNAQYLIEGSVRRHAGRVRIAVQLVRAADGTGLWSESFERSLDDAFALQSEIAMATATAIGLHISSRPILAVETLKPALIDAEVHDSYLRARHLMGQRTRPTVQAAMRYFQEALAIDPAFAPAMAGLAFCHAILPITSLLRPHDCFPAAQNLAGDALSLDPTLADAHIALGLVDFWYRRDWDAARSHLSEGAMLNPGDSAPPMFLAHIHSVLGEHEAALKTLACALRLDPISPIVRTHHGHFLYNAGRSQEALLPLKQVLELNPQFWIAHLMRGKALATPDHLPGEAPGVSATSAEAIEALLLSERFGMGNTEPLAFRVHTLAASGNGVAAKDALLEMTQRHAGNPVPPLHRALAALGTGDREAASELLEEGFAEHDVRLIFLSVETRWRALGESGYARILERAGLPNQAANVPQAG
jgi:TolB-like protein